jgi:hypothetical protein
MLDVIQEVLSQKPYPTGRIQGGWEYVWACYGITWAALLGYALSLWVRAKGLEGSQR